MALPKIDTPVYEIDLPVSKKKIKFRPFLVKEQRNLLMAMEANDIDSIQQNIRQTLINCVLTDDIDIDEMPIIDVEYLFVNLRARSVGEVVQNKYRCNNEVGDKECGNIMEVDVNVLDVHVEMDENIKDEIQLTDNITVKLKYPRFSIMKRAANLDSAASLALDIVAESIEYIYDGDQFYYAKESSPEELIEFVESLNQEQFNKLEQFFNHLPVMKKTVEMTCSKCGFEHKLEVQGLESFFG